MIRDSFDNININSIRRELVINNITNGNLASPQTPPPS